MVAAERASAKLREKNDFVQRQIDELMTTWSAEPEIHKPQEKESGETRSPARAIPKGPEMHLIGTPEHMADNQRVQELSSWDDGGWWDEPPGLECDPGQARSWQPRPPELPAGMSKGTSHHCDSSLA